LIGVCSHPELEGARGESGKELLSELASGIFMVSSILFREYAKLFEAPVFYAPNGVDLEFYQPGTQKQRSAPMRVGWAGSFANHGAEHRGYYDLVLPAVSSVDGVQLVTAAREEKWRSPEEMREFYRSLDLYLCASRNEGTPNPCMEAAACGVPLLTARVGVMPELVRDGLNGFFIERDVKNIAGKLRLLRDDPNLREQMAQQILKDIQPWDWSIRAEPYRQMFKQALRGHSAA
jgi:glycosyltransferase involved in cell wall biosynthesis